MGFLGARAAAPQSKQDALARLELVRKALLQQKPGEEVASQEVRAWKQKLLGWHDWARGAVERAAADSNDWMDPDELGQQIDFENFREDVALLQQHAQSAEKQATVESKKGWVDWARLSLLKGAGKAHAFAKEPAAW